MPVLEKIIIKDFKNIAAQEVSLSRGVNCITGDNGAGKTNLLDAVYYLSMTKSAFSQSDRYNSANGCGEFSLSGLYLFENGTENRYSVNVRKGQKTVRVNGKNYERLSEHIGVLPIVMVSPYDTSLVNESGEERRRFMNILLSQLDREYLRAMQNYNRLMMQRNSLLKSPSADIPLLSVLDSKIAAPAAYIYGKRKDFSDRILPQVRKFYAEVSGGDPDIGIAYRSDLENTGMEELLSASREKDIAAGYTLKGVHRDELDFYVGDLPLRKCGSQGQQKSFTVALKFAQYSMMRDVYGFPPLMLLDDLFDKLDPGRVTNLLRIVSGEGFGQIFLTDCNKSRAHDIMDSLSGDKACFEAKAGTFTLLEKQ